MTTSAPAPLSVADMTLRPATLEDAAFASDVATAAQPRDPEDPLLWRNWWKDEELVLQVERFIVWLEGRAVGFALRRHPSEASERFERLSAELLPPARTTARLQALLALLESRAAAEGARRFTAWAWDRDGLLNGALAKRGFREERRQRYWELHLGRNRERLERMTRDSRERMRAQGIRILTVAEDDDPEKYQKLWRMTDEAERDIPRSTPFVASPFHAFMEWMRSPGLREDRTWIARVGDSIVGISVLSYPPVRGNVATDWTGTARSARGQGVARALKCETVLQAIDLGVASVRTDNDYQNAPILHLNESMGYEPLAEKVMYLKRAEGW